MLTSLKRRAVNALKNSALIRHPYRAYTTRRQVARLAAGVIDRPCMSAAEFARMQPASFADLAVTAATTEEAALVDHESVRTYVDVKQVGPLAFRVSDRGGAFPFHTRQRMLATVYASIDPAERARMTVMDLGASVGYYAFLAAPWGFRCVEAIDARAEHATQFRLLQRALGGGARGVGFAQADFLDAFPVERYDLVLAQGILYHTFDHFDFVRRLVGLTRRYLVLETELSGYGGMLCLAKFEDTAHARMGTKGPALYPSYGAVLGMLWACGARRITRILPPADRPDLHGYRRSRRVMLLCEV